jgi:type VI secretion system protein ImpF
MDLHDRLQPALLDRLTDDQRGSAIEADERRVMSKQQIRQAVLRDLSWLLNAVQPLAGKVAERFPVPADSVLNYGLPPMAGQLASRIDVSVLERSIREAIQRFEPRILADTLEVRAIEFDSVMATHNIIEFEIRGFLWAQPVPLELLLRTQLDLEAGQVEVKDASGPAAARR